MRRLLLALALWLLPAAAGAMEFRVVTQPNGLRVLMAQGQIVAGDADRLRAVLRQNPAIDEVWLHSGGGSGQQGEAMGRLLRERGLATRVPRGSRCASACADMFLGGMIRMVDADDAYGVHMFTFSRNDRLREAARAQIQQQGAEGAGEVMRGVEQASARVMATWQRYVLEMGVSPRFVDVATQTSADEIRWLTRRELSQLNVINVLD